MPPGKFIAFYGINHIQKIGNAKRLADFIKQQNGKAEYVEYPNYSIAPSGFFIDQVLRNKVQMSEAEFQIWFCLNRFQFQPILEKKLAEGAHIIAKDYVGTAVAWATAKGVSKTWIENINSLLRKEDFAILLDTKMFAGASSEKIYGDFALIERVRQNLLELAREKEWKIIDSSRQANDVFNDVMKFCGEIGIIEK